MEYSRIQVRSFSLSLLFRYYLSGYGQGHMAVTFECGNEPPGSIKCAAFKYYKQPTRCKNNGLLIFPISSKCFGRWFHPSLGALDCVYSLLYNAPTMLPTGSLEMEELHFQATGRQHRDCIIPQAVIHSLALLKMGKIIARNILS